MNRLASYTSPTPGGSASRTTTPDVLITHVESNSEPRSEYLRRTIQERKQRRQVQYTAPPVIEQQNRPSTPDSIDLHAAHLEEHVLDDEWTAQAIPQDEPVIKKLHFRRKSSATPATVHRGPTQDMESDMSRLEKQNYDLKIRVCLQEERAKKLEADLSNALNEISKHKEATTGLEKTNARLEAANADLQTENEELLELCEQVGRDASEKVEAVDEAVDSIVQLEESRDVLQGQLSTSNDRILALEAEVEKWKALAQTQQKAQDSDYYSCDAESLVFSLSHKQSHASSRPSTAQQSDYFSSDEPTRPVSRKAAPPPPPAPTAPATKERISIKGRLQNLKRAPFHNLQRVQQMRERNSHLSLPLDSIPDVSSDPQSAVDATAPLDHDHSSFTAELSPLLDQGQTKVPSIQQPRIHHMHSHRRMRSVYVEGELVGGLAQIRSPSARSPSVRSPAGSIMEPISPLSSAGANLRRSATVAPGRQSHHHQSSLSPEPGSITSMEPCSPVSPTHVRKTSRSLRPDLPRLFTTPNLAAPRPRRNSGIVDRTTAWLGSIPGPRQNFGKDYLFNRNAPESERPHTFFGRKFTQRIPHEA